MKFYPILFSTEMVQAILAGRKKQTRRVIKPQPPVNCFDEEPLIQYDNGIKKGTEVNSELYVEWECDFPEGQSVVESHCVYSKYGKPGDVLWVRESWAQITQFGTDKSNPLKPVFPYCYKADQQEVYGLESRGGWKPSIHMPKAACRLFLQIKKIRVERLQDISEEDAIAEGAQKVWQDSKGIFWYPASESIRSVGEHGDYVTGFKSIWVTINGIESWNNNPWVWAIDFESIEKPKNFKA